jgi:elongation factor G
MKATYFEDTADGVTLRKEPIPKEYLDRAREAQAVMIERISEQDDRLMEKFVKGETPKSDEVVRVMRKATIEGRFIPVLCGAAFKNKGVRRLLDAVVDYLPSPVDLPPVIGTHTETEKELVRHPREDAPLAALAFKIQADRHMGKLTYVRVYSGVLRSAEFVYNSTRDKRQRVGRLFEMHANKQQIIESLGPGNVGAVVGLADTHTGDTICEENHPILLESIEFPVPVMSVSVKPESRVESDRLDKALAKLAEEDPTFMVRSNAETGEVVISGMGELHIEIIIDRLRREFSVAVAVGTPQVAYRETIIGAVEYDYKLVKQTGGHGQYAHIKFRIEPAEPGSGFHFVNEVREGRIPNNYIPAIERGMIDAMAVGPYAGFPMVDLRAVILDGSFHEVDSSDQAFRTCASTGLREACSRAGLELLEPVMSVEVTGPDEYIGALTGSLCSKRGRITHLETKGKTSVLQARVPLAEMFGYATELRSITSGRGDFTMHFENYEAVPYALAEEIKEKREDRRRSG